MVSEHAFVTVDSPIGRLELVSDGTAVCQLTIEGDPGMPHGTLPRGGAPGHPDAVLAQATAELTEYFAGTRTRFAVPIALSGTTFQRAVWDELTRVPHGTTLSYAELARRVGAPNAARAVGGAVGANPVPIFVPCHRVVAANGKLTGYSGGSGIETKVALLELERAL